MLETTEKRRRAVTADQIPLSILTEIKEIGHRFDLDQWILFGSRARGDHHPRSDIDLAFCARNPAEYFDVLEALSAIPTLLSFDLVDMGGIAYGGDIRGEIERDGVILYEKI